MVNSRKKKHSPPALGCDKLHCAGKFAGGAAARLCKANTQYVFERIECMGTRQYRRAIFATLGARPPSLPRTKSFRTRVAQGVMQTSSSSRGCVCIDLFRVSAKARSQ